MLHANPDRLPSGWCENLTKKNYLTLICIWRVNVILVWPSPPGANWKRKLPRALFPPKRLGVVLTPPNYPRIPLAVAVWKEGKPLRASHPRPGKARTLWAGCKRTISWQNKIRAAKNGGPVVLHRCMMMHNNKAGRLVTSSISGATRRGKPWLFIGQNGWQI